MNTIENIRKPKNYTQSTHIITENLHTLKMYMWFLACQFVLHLDCVTSYYLVSIGRIYKTNSCTLYSRSYNLLRRIVFLVNCTLHYTGKSLLLSDCEKNTCCLQIQTPKSDKTIGRRKLRTTTILERKMRGHFKLHLM